MYVLNAGVIVTARTAAEPVGNNLPGHCNYRMGLDLFPKDKEGEIRVTDNQINEWIKAKENGIEAMKWLFILVKN